MNQIKIYCQTQQFSSDLTTPMAAYLNFNAPYSFLLESVEQGEKIGRYSMIGYDPLILARGYDHYMSIQTDEDVVMHDGNSLDLLNDLYCSIDCQEHPLSPIQNGFFGYFAWEVMSQIETVNLHTKPDDCLFQYQLPKCFIVFDHVKQAIFLTVSSLSPIKAADFESYISKMSQLTGAKLALVHDFPASFDWDGIESNVSQADYEASVDTIKDYIKEGDIFQAVASQRFAIKQTKKPLAVYRSLRQINPSPYMFYFNYDEFHIIGSSPEILVQASNNRARVRPIAGTRRRTFKNEAALIKDLKADEKEIAEHIMLVDLGRNDLGRVCDFNSIKVSDLMSIETYSHVIHMVTNVDGNLKEDMTPIDLFKATFPAGTVSGAPKIRAIDILTEIEPEARGIYSGAVGYFNFQGDVDLCIAIRTIIAKDRHYYVQAGAGIVHDSVPNSEYEETKSKAQGVLLACLDSEGDL